MNQRAPLSGHQFLVILGLLAVTACADNVAFGQDKKDKKEKKTEVAGKADVLKHLPKKFASLIRVDVDNRQVELKFDDEEQSKAWNVHPDAEVKIHGWWGRLEQFQRGDRVWVWLGIDRKKQPINVLMLADEISEQDIHGLPHELKAVQAQGATITVDSKLSGERSLQFGGNTDLNGEIGHQVFVQSAGETARIVATEAQLESIREKQREWLRKRWRARGLPGTVTFLHPLGGEMEVMLDHEAIRWGRYLRTGDQVTLNTEDPIKATVKHVRPWRERTQVRIVTDSGVDQADLSLGQRIDVAVPEPPTEIQTSELPTDIGRLKSKQERVDWFLASIYCPCKIDGDVCTGMFYSLASCSVNSCGMPNQMRGQVGELIDQGLTDGQIWAELQELRGPQVVKQHLLR